jgi:hypothetical protein
MPVRALRIAAWVAAVPLAVAQNPVVRQIEQAITMDDGSALGAKLLEQSRAAGAAAVSVWLGGNPANRDKARAVLNDMDEAALDALLKAKGTVPPDEQVWRMTMIVDTLRDFRRAAARALVEQLADRRPVPRPEDRTAEERIPAHRVCDEAYIQMNRLAAANPESNDLLLRTREFLGLPEARRDAEIQRARQSAAWLNLLRR